MCLALADAVVAEANPETAEIRISRRAADRLRAGHLWVYRTELTTPASEVASGVAAGSLVTVADGAGRPMGTAMYSSSSQISLRMVSRTPGLSRAAYLDDLRARVAEAFARRRIVAPLSSTAGRETDAQRLLFAEAVGVPRSVADRSAGVVVVQLLTQGTAQDDVRGALVEALRAELGPKGEALTIWERPDARIRELEALPVPSDGPLFSSVPGEETREADPSAAPRGNSDLKEESVQDGTTEAGVGAPTSTTFLLNGLQFGYDAGAGQKTGAFLDQRLNYEAAAQWVERSGRTRHALDVCTYHGGFALHLARVCRRVTGVDASRAALQAADHNFASNRAQCGAVDWIEADAFDLLRALDEASRDPGATAPATVPKAKAKGIAGMPNRFDAIVLDPPAFAKSKRAAEGALRGYKELNLRAMRLLAPGGTLVTCSCSHHVPMEGFVATVTEAAADAGRRVQLLEARAAAPDHPEVLTLPETRYLKCLICRVEESPYRRLLPFQLCGYLERKLGCCEKGCATEEKQKFSHDRFLICSDATKAHNVSRRYMIAYPVLMHGFTLPVQEPSPQHGNGKVLRTGLAISPPVFSLLVVALLVWSGARAETQQAPRKATSAAAGRSLAREADPAIARVIASTPAIDDHAHPVLSPPAMATDRDFDALPVDNMEPETDPLAWRPDYAPLAEAWTALYGFHGKAPLTRAEQVQLEAIRNRVREREGEHYSDWVLDRAGIGTMIANRVHLGTGVNPPRFRWVPYDDALLFPLQNVGLAAATPDRAQFFALEDKLRTRLLGEAGLQRMPPTLDLYLTQFVTPTLTAQKAGGAVAVKFEVAYLRDFDFADTPREQAATAYAQYIGGGTPDPAAYKKLQDFLFRYIAGECGRLGMAVHLHGMAGGGRYFSIAGVDPLLLEPVLNDARLKRTNFVLLHGGWPYVREAGAMLQKPNFYLDMSQQALIFPARTLAGWLREWLETYPEKVLFGTDAYPYSPAMGWEEAAWLAARNERLALGLALTGMERDGEITPARAAELARMVLRGNAETLYRLPH